jgi:hypothetical protein
LKNQNPKYLLQIIIHNQNSLKMKLTTIVALGLLMVFGWYDAMFAQTKRSITVIASTDAWELAYGQPNVEAQIFPLHNIGISGRIAQKKYQESLEFFNGEVSGFLLGAEFKYFPFGGPRNYDFRTLTQRGIRHYFDWNDTFLERYFRGTFVAFGYEYKSTETKMTPVEELGSPIPSFPFTTIDRGPTLQLGYGASFNHLYLGVGYRFKFSTVNTTSDVPGLKVHYTPETSIIKMLDNSALQVNIGLSF